jgi:transcriptional regulator with XRE-family HTH domain
MKTTFGERLKIVLAVYGLSQSKFALQIGVDSPKISNIIAGRVEPSFKTLQKILLALPEGCDRYLILGGIKYWNK